MAKLTPTTISTQLYKGERVLLSGFDHDKDASVEATWTHDPDYMRQLYYTPMKPKTQAQIKQKYLDLEKKIEQDKDIFYFQVRLANTLELIGFCQIFNIMWTHRTCQFLLGIGSGQHRRQGLGSQVLDLAMSFAANELNMEKFSAAVPSYNIAAIHLFEKAHFELEARRREALLRDLQRWDILTYGRLDGAQ